MERAGGLKSHPALTLFDPLFAAVPLAYFGTKIPFYYAPAFVVEVFAVFCIDTRLLEFFPVGIAAYTPSSHGIKSPLDINSYRATTVESRISGNLVLLGEPANELTMTLRLLILLAASTSALYAPLRIPIFFYFQHLQRQWVSRVWIIIPFFCKNSNDLLSYPEFNTFMLQLFKKEGR